MVKRIVIVAALASLPGSLYADGPFGRRGAFGIFSRRSAPQQELGNGGAVSPYRHLMNSPEKLTELFGPSILIRERQRASIPARPANKVSRFVTQPSD